MEVEMSLQKDGRNFRQQSGNNFPTFAAAVAQALRREYDHPQNGIGKVVALTGANERTVRNWFEAKNGPGGEYLITLCRHSDEVLITVLTLSGRASHARLTSLEQAKQKLIQARTLLLGLDLDY
jgi:hypothetical protein